MNIENWIMQISLSPMLKQFITLVVAIFLLCFFSTSSKQRIEWFKQKKKKGMKIWECLTQTKKGRFISLIILSIVGMFLTTLFSDCIIELLSFDGNESQESYAASSIRVLLLGLPVFIGLWYFRTHDTREQIEKTQEHIEKSDKSIHTAILSNGFILITSPELVSRCIGVKSLATLRRNYPAFSDQIDSATDGLILTSEAQLNAPEDPTNEQIKQINESSEVANFFGANLQGMSLLLAKLQGANLLVAKLQGSYLQGTDLQRADLRGAELQGANLEEADLRGADLRGAELQGAELQEAKLQGAYYNEKTIFPADFDPEENDMIEVDENGNFTVLIKKE